MPNVKDIYNYIDTIAPYSLQESYDNSGMNVMFGDKDITKVLIALDITTEVVEEAAKKGADLIITHHPVIFGAVTSLRGTDAVVKLCQNQISALSAHTNFDSAVMNDILCEELGMTPIAPLCSEGEKTTGNICWLDREYSSADFVELVQENLGNTVIRYNRTNKPIRTVGICSGSGGSFMKEALSKGCDAYITGDVKHDVFIDAHNAGMCVIDAGHFHTENIFCSYMQSKLSETFADVVFEVADSNCDILSYSTKAGKKRAQIK